MHYYQFNIGCYKTHTEHLEPMEDLAYRRMLDLYYTHEAPLPNDVQEIAKKIRMRTHCDCITNVLHEFFTLEEDGYHNRGADKELQRIYAKSAKAKASAEARWSKNSKKNNDLGDDANAMRTQCEKDANGMLPKTYNPRPNTHNPKPNSKSENKFSDDDMKLSKFIFRKIKELNPEAKEPNYNQWADTVRLARERDKRSHKDLQDVFLWANNDDFWKANILSPAKLREKYDDLKIKMNIKHGGNDEWDNLN